MNILQNSATLVSTSSRCIRYIWPPTLYFYHQCCSALCELSKLNNFCKVWVSQECRHLSCPITEKPEVTKSEEEWQGWLRALVWECAAGEAVRRHRGNNVMLDKRPKQCHTNSSTSATINQKDKHPELSEEHVSTCKARSEKYFAIVANSQQKCIKT